ncbi:MAG: hypothetical protein Q7R30_00285 [Acidobacteriota bacterium]|nr:hypothetical protein [Acidobacteriota bacterium]
MKKQMSTWIVLAVLAAAIPAAAQEPAKPAVDMGEMRHHIYVMEGALARAVDYGAKKLNKEILDVMPGVFMLAGDAQARGVYLEGYGVFFDVQVPMLRQSMIWSLRMMLDQDDAATQAAITDLRKHLQGITDPATRASLERALKQLEVTAAGSQALPRNASQGGRDPGVATGLMMPPERGVGAANAAAAAGARPATTATAKSYLQDPNRAYTEAVTRALVDTMLIYSAPLEIGPDQWLTVAARDNEPRDTLAPQDPFEEVVTMIYRIKGSDLLAYRSGKIDKDEARKRVLMGQF